MNTVLHLRYDHVDEVGSRCAPADADTWKTLVHPSPGFVPRVGDEVWTYDRDRPAQAAFRPVLRVSILLPNQGAQAPGLTAHVDLGDPV